MVLFMQVCDYTYVHKNENFDTLPQQKLCSWLMIDQIQSFLFKLKILTNLFSHVGVSDFVNQSLIIFLMRRYLITIVPFFFSVRCNDNAHLCALFAGNFWDFWQGQLHFNCYNKWKSDIYVFDVNLLKNDKFRLLLW